MAPRSATTLRDRHVVILDMPGVHGPSAHRAGVARFLSRLDTLGGRPHAVVCRCLAPGTEATLALGPMRPAQLRRSVLCTGIDAVRTERAVDEGGAAIGRLARCVCRARQGVARPPRPERALSIFAAGRGCRAGDRSAAPRTRRVGCARRRPGVGHAGPGRRTRRAWAARGRRAPPPADRRLPPAAAARRRPGPGAARAGQTALREGPPASGPRGVRSQPAALRRRRGRGRRRARAGPSGRPPHRRRRAAGCGIRAENRGGRRHARGVG